MERYYFTKPLHGPAYSWLFSCVVPSNPFWLAMVYEAGGASDEVLVEGEDEMLRIRWCAPCACTIDTYAQDTCAHAHGCREAHIFALRVAHSASYLRYEAFRGHETAARLSPHQIFAV